MAVNKVIFGGDTIIDLTADSVTPETLAVGVTAHDASGKVVTGTMEAGITLPTLTNEGAAADLLSGKQLIDGAGNIVTGGMPSVTQATPSISVSSGGLITASATQEAGKVASGTKSATKQLTVQAAQTITPGTENKTLASGLYLTGAQTITGDANLIAENIRSGVSIFDVLGTLEAGTGGGSNEEVFFETGVFVPSEDITLSSMLATAPTTIELNLPFDPMVFCLWENQLGNPNRIDKVDMCIVMNEGISNQSMLGAMSIASMGMKDSENFVGYKYAVTAYWDMWKDYLSKDGVKILAHRKSGTSVLASGRTYYWVAFGEPGDMA